MTIASAALRLRAAMSAANDKTARKPMDASADGGLTFKHWNIPEGSSAIIRFLPDANAGNPYFWVEKEVIKLPFVSQVGGDYPSDRPVTVEVPCVAMWGDRCPIIQHCKPWWRQGDDMVALARTYYKKRSFIYQGFVVASPLDEEPPVNPIRRFLITPSIQALITQALADPDLEDLPIEFTTGRDFKVAKTRQGEYANYGTSSWAMRTRALSDAETAAIKTHGLVDLATYKGERPTASGIATIYSMFQDSLAGKPFDAARFPQYRAWGERADANPAQIQAPVSAPVPARKPDAHGAAQAKDVLARIRLNTSATAA